MKLAHPADEPEITVALCRTEEEIQEAAAAGYAVIGLSEGLSAGYIVLSEDAVEDFDLRRAYARHHHLPMTILETPRTTVREISLSDLDALFLLYSPPEMTAYMEPLFPYDEELSYQKQYIEYVYGIYDYGMWVVTDKETGTLLGRAGVESRDGLPAGTVELGYAIGVPYQGQGIGTEVCRAILSYTKEVLHKDTVTLRVNPLNVPSFRLAKRLGFTAVSETPDEKGELRMRLRL